MYRLRGHVFLLLLLLTASVCCSRRHHEGLMAPPPPPSNDWSPPIDLWFTQRLDHFSSNPRTWQQRYFVNSTFYRTGGPVFLMIGGEGEANPVWMATGTWLEYAREMGAMCFMLEHRFYGKSHPTDDMSVANLQYLSSWQALADLAAFTEAMTVEHGLHGARWLAFGGSYPGALAAWYRLKYPHLVHAAVASSAPVTAQTDFPEYLQVVSSSLEMAGSEQCVGEVAKAFGELRKLLQDQRSRQLLKHQFRICKKLEVSEANYFLSLLMAIFEDVVQYSGDNRLTRTAPEFDIDDLCHVMTAGGVGSNVTVLSRLVTLNQMFLQRANQTCLETRPSIEDDQLRNIHFDTNDNNGGRQWLFQTCNEFGWYQTTDSDQQPFGHFVSLSDAILQCSDVFGDGYNGSVVSANVRETNARYGGASYSGSRVVFVNGSLDPWHVMSLTAAPTNDTRAIYINGTAHCANMYPPRESDLARLVDARAEIKSIISDWLTQ